MRCVWLTLSCEMDITTGFQAWIAQLFWMIEILIRRQTETQKAS
jgi:hypothetical protein